MNHAKSSKLEKFEIPGAVTLTYIEWTPVRTFHFSTYTTQDLRMKIIFPNCLTLLFQDTGLTTAAMKLKRKPLQEFYLDDLDRMYGN